MFRRQHNESERQADVRMGALMAHWRSVEPAVDFEQAVWRRIRAEAAAVPQHKGLAGWMCLPGWPLIPVPGRLLAVAAVVLFLLGAGGLGVAAGKADAAVRHPYATPLLAANTIAGAYASLATGGLQ
jgi:hypothetical protein